MKKNTSPCPVWDLDRVIDEAMESGHLSFEALSPFWNDADRFDGAAETLAQTTASLGLRVEYRHLCDSANRMRPIQAETGNPTSIYLGELQQMEASTREDEILLAKQIEFARKVLSNLVLGLAEDSERRGVAESFRELIHQDGGVQLHFDPVEQHFTLDVSEPLEEASDWIESLEAGSLDRLRTAYDDLQALKGDMIRGNLYLVLSSARRYRRKGLPFMDLIQEGNTGLLRAVEKFDWRRGFRFQTYASWWIIEAIKRALYNQARLIRVPIYLSQKLDRKKQEIEPEDPKKALLAGNQGDQLPTDVPGYHRRVFSLDQVSDRFDDLSFVDMLEDKKTRGPVEVLQEESLRDKINVILKTLSDREREILELRYGLNDRRPHTLEEISRKFHVSRERIRQIQQKSLRKLQSPLRFDEFADLLTSTD